MSVATGSHTRWLEEREWAPPPPARPIRIVGGVVEELDEVELEPEPEPEPAVEFSLAPGDQARVAARAGVVFRSGAEMDSEQLGILEHGEVIDVREVRPLDVSQLQPGQRQRVRFGRCVRVPDGVEEIIGWTSAGEGRYGPLLEKVFTVALDDKTSPLIEPGMNRNTPAWFWSAPHRRMPISGAFPVSSLLPAPSSKGSFSPEQALPSVADSHEDFSICPDDLSACDTSVASSCRSSSRGSPSNKLKLVVDHEYEAYRAQTGEPVTAPAPEWYTCMYCMTPGEHFRGACPRMRPTTRDRPVRPAFDEGHGMGVDWVWDKDDVIVLPRQPGLLGRLQAEHRALEEAADAPRADNRTTVDAYRASALAVYKAVPTWAPDAKLLRDACGKVQQTAEALHLAEKSLMEMTDRQRQKQGAAAEARIEGLRADLAAARSGADALNKSGDFFRRVEALRLEPVYRERLTADPPPPPGVAAFAWAAAHEQRASMPSRLRSLLTPQERTRLAYLKQWNRLRRGRRAARRAAIGSVKAVGSACKITFRIGRHLVRSTHSWAKSTSRTMRKEVDEVADIMGWWKPKLTPPPTPDEFTNIDRQTLHGMGFTDDQENEKVMRECGYDFDAAVRRLEKEREAKGEAVSVIKREHNRARQDEMEVRSGWLDDMGLQLSQYGSMKGVGWAGEIRYMGIDSEMVYDYGSRRGATPDLPKGSRFAASAYEQQIAQRHQALADAKYTSQAGFRGAWSASEE